jgi:hypothetical protein
LRKIAEARTKIEARAKERHAREMAEYEAKLAARDATTYVPPLPRHFHKPRTKWSGSATSNDASGTQMPKVKLTKRTVDCLKVREKDHITFNTDLPGFGLRLMPSGKRFFLVQYRRHGRARRVMIGQSGPVTAQNARRDANVELMATLLPSQFEDVGAPSFFVVSAFACVSHASDAGIIGLKFHVRGVFCRDKAC